MRDAKQREILAAGAAAAFTVDMLVYPLDTIKTRYQSQGLGGLNQVSSGKKAPYQALRGLYQGIGSVVLATLPAAAIFFASYESAKSLLKGNLPNAVPDPAIHAVASAGAEMASCAVLTPAEVIKQNAQVLQQSGPHRVGQSSSLQAFRMLRRSEGGAPRSLWRGYAVLVARNLPFTTIHFPMFELFRGQLWKWRQHQGSGPSYASTITTGDDDGPGQGLHWSEGEHESPRGLIIETGMVTAGAAAGSGSLAAFITTPADVVKTRVMLEAVDGAGGLSWRSDGLSRRDRTGALDVARLILHENGLRGIFRGAMLRAAWAALGSGLYLGSYEATKIWLEHRSS